MSASDFNARQKARRLATCRHFTGIQNKACSVGIRYENVRDAGVRPYRLTCTGDEGASVCPSKSLRTHEEIEAEDRDFAERWKHIGTVRAAIIATRQARGRIDCPRCGRQEALAFSVTPYNGHVHAVCSTPHCLCWME